MNRADRDIPHGDRKSVDPWGRWVTRLRYRHKSPVVKVGHGFMGTDLNGLTHDTETSADGDFARLRIPLTRDQSEKGRLTDAVPADQPRPSQSKTKVHMRE